ncbi:DUF4400 domain-containing protein [Candidatus Accumulibacter sp. ACC012]|jgi:hypothetical protein|uniref:DUF4400 domain-containing protein n=1 Tax=Candidatus Accumulibacter meliphilus TaxID=2211374 RepID=A0A369XTU8_9PROT|nr:DUF4400 domain-containing protein [Candidatus Accumulibacter sp. ACC012]RDE51617.1 MAG: DUF4400 domain-containing protein [Candidatus Accumulibacter meliphilus]
MRAARTENAWSTFIAVALFLVMAATWAFIPPAVIRNAWIAERAEVYALAGSGESAVYGRTLEDLEKSLASDFRGFFIGAQSTGQGPFGSVDFSAWARDRIVASWLWIGLVAYRLQVLMGWLVPGIPLVMAAYSDGQLVREIRKYSFVAQSPIRHSLGVRVLWAVLAGLAVWMIVPLPMPSLLPPLLIVSISYALWLWVSNLQKRL